MARTSPIIYRTFNYQPSAPGSSTSITGVRGVDKNDVLITGEYINSGSALGFLYWGNFRGEGNFFTLNFPDSFTTAPYGPDSLSRGRVAVVGSYKMEDGGNDFAFLYRGLIEGAGEWTTLLPPFGVVKNTIAHSTMNGIVVGNYQHDDLLGHAFIYDSSLNRFYKLEHYAEAANITAYGIWHDGGSLYTIAGSYSRIESGDIEVAYLVHWDSKTGKLFDWRTYSYNDDPDFYKVTHFDGISGDGNGGYTVVGGFGSTSGTESGFFARIDRHKNGEFCHAEWLPLSFPATGVTATQATTVYYNYALGVYTQELNGVTALNGYVARVEEC